MEVGKGIVLSCLWRGWYGGVGVWRIWGGRRGGRVGGPICVGGRRGGNETLIYDYEYSVF